jgi:hypothetical protein
MKKISNLRAAGTATKTAWDITGTGGRCYNLDMIGKSITLSNTLNINPNADEIEGVQYQSIANALTYIGTQTPVPSDTNRWGLMVSGTLGENIDLGYMAYIDIVGTENALLTGTINNSNTSSNIQWNSATLGSYPWVICNCTISNLNLTYNSLSSFVNCKITGGTATNDSNMIIDGGMVTGGNLNVNIGCFNDCMITGGSFGDPDKGGLFLYDMKVIGGTFYNRKMTALNSTFMSLFNINLCGGTFSNCSLGNVSMRFNNSTQYIFFSCATLPFIDMTGGSENPNPYTGVSVSLYNTLYSRIVIGSGNTLATSNSYCMGDTVIPNGGVWTQFDNAVSITSGTVDGTAIGVTTPAEGHFTDLSASSLMLPGKTPVNAVAATGTISVSDTPVADQTLGVDTLTFYFKLSRSAAGEITISSDPATQAVNIKDAITADLATVSAVINSGVASQVDLSAAARGTAGNAIALSAVATGIAVSGAGYLAGGVDGTVGKAGEVYRDSSYIYNCIVDNTVADANWRRVSLGSAF